MQIIVAAGSDWGIGRCGKQQLVAPADRRHFRELTIGCSVIVGRRTVEDFPDGKPLEGRRNFILTRDIDYAPQGEAVAVRSTDELFSVLKHYESDKVFIIGGGSVYKELLPYAKTAHVTRFTAAPPADTFFPNLDELSAWQLIKRGKKLVSNGFEMSFDVYENKKPLSV